MQLTPVSRLFPTSDHSDTWNKKNLLLEGWYDLLCYLVIKTDETDVFFALKVLPTAAGSVTFRKGKE